MATLFLLVSRRIRQFWNVPKTPTKDVGAIRTNRERFLTKEKQFKVTQKQFHNKKKNSHINKLLKQKIKKINKTPNQLLITLHESYQLWKQNKKSKF